MGVTSWSDEQDAILLGGLKADCTYMQIANMLGISKAMVSGRIYRLRKLRPQDVPLKGAQSVRAVKRDSLRRSSFQNTRGKATINQAKAGDCVSRVVGEGAGEKRIIEKPLNAPLSFLQLEQGQCSWQIGDYEGGGFDQIMCCAAPVIDKTRREGDRRASHCAYHYELGTKRLS